ncbi:MAG: hypothetical protein Q8Q09_12720 [Deltaproteobacteria bacterium]|nr:hypothetical protein [Deltaproteobacteria bacterium]
MANAKKKAKGTKTASATKAPAKPATKAPAAKAPAAKTAKAPASKAPAAKAPAAKKSAKPAKEAAKPASKVAAKAVEASKAPAATTSAEVAGVVRKKKNVKRGAPPMLPRRNLRREVPPPGSPPPPPRAPMMAGSLHAPARAPEGLDQTKKRIAQIHSLLSQLKNMKRSMTRQFFEMGLVLEKLDNPELYKARGFASFDNFVEREIERDINIGRSDVSVLLKIVKIFQRPAAEEAGLERLRAALKAMYPEPGTLSA